jgi:phosphatidate cytidylyltransferase
MAKPPRRTSPTAKVWGRWLIGGAATLLIVLAATLSMEWGKTARTGLGLLGFGIMTSAALLEGYRVLSKAFHLPSDPFAQGITLGVNWLAILCIAMLSTSPFALLISVSMLLSVMLIWREREVPTQRLSVGLILSTWVIIPLGLALWIWCHEEQGPFWILWTVLIAKGGDTVAYLVGRRWGRWRAFPLISPRKTWEGLIASLCFGTTVGAASSVSCGIGDPLWGATLGLLIGIVGALGDLGESLLKRQAKMKDSGVLIGIGGILDMVDALLTAFPILWLAQYAPIWP